MPTNDQEVVDDVIEELPEFEDGEEDTTDYKALAAKNAGIAKRFKTKLEKQKLDAKVDKKVEKVIESKEKEGFGYAEKAYLRAEGIKANEFSLVEEAVKDSGKSIEAVLESKWFQAQLKEAREEADTKAAVPTGSKRSQNATRDSVEYWLGKGELPPADQTELRRKVVNARIKQEGEVNVFTKTSVVGSA